ncbi:MAG: hypothetical protein ACI8RD_007389 [Bacillariaceae sp.]|jgi:hypothetical protein
MNSLVFEQSDDDEYPLDVEVEDNVQQAGERKQDIMSRIMIVLIQSKYPIFKTESQGGKFKTEGSLYKKDVILTLRETVEGNLFIESNPNIQFTYRGPFKNKWDIRVKLGELSVSN